MCKYVFMIEKIELNYDINSFLLMVLILKFNIYNEVKILAYIFKFMFLLFNFYEIKNEKNH